MNCYKKYAYVVGCAMSLAGCDSSTPEKEVQRPNYLEASQPWQHAMQLAVKQLQKGEAKAASRTINSALQDFPKEPSLHLLNGLIYEELSRQGDEGARDLGFIAYQTTLSLDPSNWYGLYRAALIKLADRDCPNAQELFARSALLKPNNPQTLYGLAMASYYACDIPVACVSIEQALIHYKGEDPLFYRAAALIFAAAGEKEKSDYYFHKFKQKVPSSESDISSLEERMERWTALHQKNLYRTVADSSAPSDPTDTDSTAVNTSIDPMTIPEDDTSDRKEVIIFDCYVLKITESISNTKGLNLFQQNMTQGLTNPLTLTLQPQNIAYSFVGGGRTTQKSIAWSPIIYNLNIMNVIDNRVEVLGRPTLSTFLKIQANFSSGNYYSSGLTGSSGGSLINIPTGIIMNIMPTKIEGDMITVDVEIESTVPDTVNTSASFASQILLLLKTKMETTMQIKFNETGMIGGDYQRQTSYRKNGFPILEDLPIIQFLASREESVYKKQSALFLITPRRPETVQRMARRKLTLRQQRNSLPCLTRWYRNHKEFQDRDPVLGLIIDELAPRDAVQYYRRGDVLPIHDESLTSLRQENVSWRSFLYY